MIKEEIADIFKILEAKLDYSQYGTRTTHLNNHLNKHDISSVDNPMTSIMMLGWKRFWLQLRKSYVLGTIAPYHHQPSSTNSSFEHCSHEENGMKDIHWPRLNHMARKSYTCPQFMQCSAPNLLVIASVLDLQFQFIMCCMYIYIYRACRVPYITVHLQRADRTCHVDMCEDCNSFTTHMQRVPPLHTVTLGDICLSWSQNMISSWPTGKKQPIGQIAAVCASAPKNVTFFLHGWKRSFFRP